MAMCLVAIAWLCHPRWRLLVAGNRDEFHVRPTAPLRRWPGQAGAPGLLAGRDLQSGGTWMGLDTLGRAAVVTNVRDGALPGAPPAPGSRGALPVDYLGGHQGACERAESVLDQTAGMAPFNLLLADGNDCCHVGNHPRQAQRVVPGVHVMSNGRFDQAWPKTRHLGQALEQWLADRTGNPEPLWRALADERIAADAELPDTGVGIELERRLSPAFIRGPIYGTRASTLLAVDHQGQGWISERRFGPDGEPQGETALRNTPHGVT